ncbi:glycosyltransferase family protein [Myroides odoratimimus]|uniref:Glycosyltransferase subfamily 4-like N-terminal domain-containing protein n=1 Tax=Myroides odoratimimus CIP 101113 TaxID=883154 RepID=A0AAV3F1R7_9FLAO|nr:hypothetical protein [Myroides odoratimimus]EHO09921.1 hypothetical protein HMPREF9715_02222 [Myroides odoratimimus CIP 101113]
MKRILVLSHVVFPVNNARVNRTIELVKELSNRGYVIELAACLGSYDYNNFSKENNVKISNLGDNFFHIYNSDDNIQKQNFFVKYLRLCVRPFFDLRDLELSYFSYKFLKKNRKYDVVISIAPPHALNWGISLFKTFNPNTVFKWIADCGDPYYKNPFHKYPLPFYFKFIEKWFCRRVDKIVIPVEIGKEGYFEEFHSKISVIPQGVDFKQFKLTPFVENSVITFVYAGAIYPGKRDPFLFLEFLCSLEYDFVFKIYCNNLSLLTKYKEKLGSKLELYEYVDRVELVNVLSKADFLVNILNEGTVQSPSKLIDYGLSQRPILNIDSKVLDKEKIEEFFKRDYRNSFVVPNLQDYSIDNVVDKFIECF